MDQFKAPSLVVILRHSLRPQTITRQQSTARKQNRREDKTYKCEKRCDLRFDDDGKFSLRESNKANEANLG